MTRLTLALAAAAVLAAGCGPGPCQRDVTVDWSGGFLGADGVRRGCAAAGVTWVDLFVNDDPSTSARVPCSQLAAQAVDVPAGSNLYTVEGVEAGGRIAFRAEVSVAAACGSGTAIAVVPAEGTLAVDYAFAPTNACFATQPTYVWSEVHDDIANQVAFADTGTGSQNLCSTTAPAPTYRLPAGSYTYVGANEWSPGAGYVGADCTPRSFVITAAQQTTVSPVMVDSSRACF